MLLDYDGTLMPFSMKPDQAKPDIRLVRLLKMLTKDTHNTLVVISGRDRSLLEQWLGKIPCGLVAEHGAWIKKEFERGWQRPRNLSSGWKGQLKPIIQDYIVRVPGSLMEEKEYGIAWHYRKAEPELGTIRASELFDYLNGFLASTDLQVMHGNKVVEVRISGVNKGSGAKLWLKDKEWDFILALGDDWTDEDMFKALPSMAYSIKVTYGPTEAKYYLDSPQSVRKLLLKLAKL